MKEATGEMNMTVITIIAIGAVLLFFWIMWPTIKNSIGSQWNKVDSGCPDGTTLVNGECVKQ